MIYTSYYANRKCKFTKVAISLYPPKWFIGHTMSMLAPPQHIFNMRQDRAKYTNAFNDYLESLSLIEINDGLRLYDFENVALCCFESLRKPGEWCHRTIVAEFLNRTFNLNIQEYKG